MLSRQKILVFDSGLGGISVFRAIRALRPDADYLYLADDARFPYGALTRDVLVPRVEDVIAQALRDFAADALVIACATASTLVLPPLRARYPEIPIIGTVPAVKTAAAITKSGMISILATPGTVSRDYTQRLIADHAAHCAVTLVGAEHLATLAEADLRGEVVSDTTISAEIAPAFIDAAGTRTDAIVLGCTHYPLLLDRLTALAPWPVTWIDPAPAIARRVVHLLGDVQADGEGNVQTMFTSGETPTDVAYRAFSNKVEITLREELKNRASENATKQEDRAYPMVQSLPDML